MQCKYLHYTNVLKSLRLANQYCRRNLKNLYIRDSPKPQYDLWKETVALINSNSENAAFDTPKDSDKIFMMFSVILR